MPNKGYKTLTIPESLYEVLEKYVQNSTGYYASISEVVREALRKFVILNKIKKKIDEI